MSTKCNTVHVFLKMFWCFFFFEGHIHHNSYLIESTLIDDIYVSLNNSNMFAANFIMDKGIYKNFILTNYSYDMKCLEKKKHKWKILNLLNNIHTHLYLHVHND